MNKITALLIVAFCLCITTTIKAQNTNHSGQLLRHVVLFKFKDSASAQNIKKVETAFRALPKKIALIKDFEWGINNSPEKFNEGFTHCFVLSYRSEKDLENYQENPAHKAFQEVLKPHMEKVFVVDYWMK